ncbi:MAG: hypothetical protein KA171_00390 [Reyranella sp.]|nr:hypothetical protein [Reyranella sp.]
MTDRRTLVGLLTLPGMPSPGQSQTGAGFVGACKGMVDGIGDATLTTKGVGPGNLVSRATLKIDTALGGIYNLTLAGTRLAGHYTRGNAFRSGGTQ